MNNITIGIDPGLSGAISICFDHGEAYVYDLPVIEDKSLKWIDGGALASLILEHPGRRWAFIERVSAMPKQGIASSFNFGVGYGSLLGVLQVLQIPFEFVTPAKWKRDMGLASDKKASLHKARMLFPRAELHLCKHDGRAEALLIARWAAMHRARVVPVRSGGVECEVRQ